MIRKRISTVIIILICFLLQTTLFKHLSLASVSPNLLLIVTVSIGYIRGRTEGLFVGLICGFLMDMMFGTVLGLFAFILMVLGYFSGLCHKVYNTNDSIVPIILVAFCDFGYGLFVYICEYLMRGRIHFFFYLFRIILPEVIYTVAISLLLYRFMHYLDAIFTRRAKEV